MLRTRVIPCLLLKGLGLVKTKGFKKPKYVGDPINAVKIFNDKEVDELAFLDIEASARNQSPKFDLISQIAGECFMPFSYGGGIRTVADIKKILSLGAEKVVLNTSVFRNPELIQNAAANFGSQSIVASIDVKKNIWGKYRVYAVGGSDNTGRDPVDHAKAVEAEGAGEILLTSIDRDGTMSGYDTQLIKSVADAVDIPVIACGGAGELNHLAEAVHIGGASAAAAGSLFVFHDKNRAVLINYPTQEQLKKCFP